MLQTLKARQILLKWKKKKVHLISQIHDVSQFSLTNLSTAKNNGSAYICHHGQSRLEIGWANVWYYLR